MALINCPDCGTEVSDAARACPKCARPITPEPTGIRSSPPVQKKKGVGAVATLVVFIALAGWIYYQASTPDQSPATDASQVSSTPAAGMSTGDTQAPQATSAQARPVFVTTPADLYREYSTNEVATNQALAGKTIQFTAPVLSIDEDFTDSAVLTFATGDQFNNLQATLKDSDKAAAAQLSPGQVVTVRCASFDRIMDSPMGSDCTFLVGGASSTDSSQTAPAQNVAINQPTATVTTPGEAATAAVAKTTDSMPVPDGSVSSTAQESETNASGPSFDCSKARDATARTICSNAELCGLDRQMADLYHARMQSVDDPTVRDAQRAWLLDRNQCGADVICLQKQYAARIQQLQE